LSLTISLAAHIQRLVSLDAQTRQLVELRTPVQRVPRRERVGPTDAAAYVESGLLRLVSLDPEGKERTLDFALEGWWIADWNSFFQERPKASPLDMYYLEAVEESRIVCLTNAHYTALIEQVPALERYFRAVFQKIAAVNQRRVHLNAVHTGEAMYLNFARSYPEFLQRIPQYMLASFLGLTPEFLSKIRGKSASPRSFLN